MKPCARNEGERKVNSCPRGNAPPGEGETGRKRKVFPRGLAREAGIVLA